LANMTRTINLVTAANTLLITSSPPAVTNIPAIYDGWWARMAAGQTGSLPAPGKCAALIPPSRAN
jgi:hypothetical protein